MRGLFRIKMINLNKPELMAPAGSWESLMAAIKARADSVYFGVEELNMRARSAQNFSINDIKKIVSVCRKNKIKTYLALNIIFYDDEIEEMKKICNAAKKAGIDAVIASDISAIQYANLIGLRVNISTQANVSNFEAVKFYSKFADAVVLARELEIDKIKSIIDRIKAERLEGPNGKLMRVEIFAHGALCVSIAGKCYMSLSLYNHSANRGDCLQPCRRAYHVIDEETGNELKIDNKFVMSPKDLCTIGFLDKIIESGVNILKIEGRGRSPDYVYTVAKAYKDAIESYFKGEYTKEKIKAWTDELDTVFNRGFWQGGYYLGKKLGEWSGSFGSKSSKRKELIGIVANYFLKNKVALIEMKSGSLMVGDEILITGPTTGVVKNKVEDIWIDNKPVNKSAKGDLISVKIAEKVRKNDKVYVLADTKALLEA